MESLQRDYAPNSKIGESASSNAAMISSEGSQPMLKRSRSGSRWRGSIALRSKEMGGDAETLGESFDVGGGETAFALEDAVGDGAINGQDFGEVFAAQFVFV